MRKYLSENALLKKVVDLKHFQAFNATTYTAITVLQKKLMCGILLKGDLMEKYSDYLIELKTVKGNTFPFSNLRQYDLLLKQAGKEGVIPCVIIWFYDRDTVLFVPVTVCRDMISEGKKSIRFDGFTKNESIFKKNLHTLLIFNIIFLL